MAAPFTPFIMKHLLQLVFLLVSYNVLSQTTTENYVLSRSYKNAGMTDVVGTAFSGTPATVSTNIV